MIDLNRYWDFLVESGTATENEIDLITKINGWNKETFDDIYMLEQVTET